MATKKSELYSSLWASCDERRGSMDASQYKDYNLIRINELTWDQFLYFKRWHSTMSAWNLPINNELLEATKTILKA